MAGALFKVPERAGRAADAAIAKKANSRSKSVTAVKGGNGLVERINTARAIVEQNLGQYRDDYEVIQDESRLTSYIDHIIENNLISLDTETTGLDPLLNDIVGICIYTPGERAAYIPVNHKSYVTGELIENQLPVDFVREQFERLPSDIECIMFHAAFDMRFMKNKIGVSLNCTWDCYLAARLLNENEPANLKALHLKYCTDGSGTAARFNDLFEGITFDLVPIKLGYMYAARDALITYELYMFQKPYLTSDDPVCIEHELTDIAWIFHNIEMPCVSVVADLENLGVAFDFDKADELRVIYHQKLDEAQENCYKVLCLYESEIAQYKAKNPGCKLSDPVNLSSPQQIAIILYDIMKCAAVDKDSPRGTGEKILNRINNDFTKALLSYRELDKLVGTYIDKLPECVNPNDLRIHCKFNQYGADTGRFSSSDPNLQNIPSHNKDIRKMFKATDGYVLMSSDFSQQDGEFIEVTSYGEVETPNGRKHIVDLVVGDSIVFDDLSVGVLTKISRPVDKSHLLLYYTVKVVD